MWKIKNIYIFKKLIRKTIIKNRFKFGCDIVELMVGESIDEGTGDWHPSYHQ